MAKTKPTKTAKADAALRILLRFWGTDTAYRMSGTEKKFLRDIRRAIAAAEKRRDEAWKNLLLDLPRLTRSQLDWVNEQTKRKGKTHD